MRIALFPLFAALAACSPAMMPEANGSTAAPDVRPTELPTAEPSLLGQWEIVAIDGTPPATGIRPEARIGLSFSDNGYGGDVGCNGFGGIGLATDGRWYAGYAMSTAMACGEPINTQESIVQGMMGSGPRIEWHGADAVSLIGAMHRLDLRRAGPLTGKREPYAPPPMMGSRFSFGSLDGKAIEMPGVRQGPVLIVEGDTYSFETPCLTQRGAWRQSGAGAVLLTPGAAQPRNCDAASRGQSEAWVAAMRGPLNYVTGPNGEVVLAGGGHWMVGDAVRRGSADAALIEGKWRIEGAAAGQNGARPPEVIFAKNAYYLWDGCNHSEGLAILFERKLSTHGSGLSTLAACAPGQVDARLGEIVTSAPLIGLTEGGVRLVSAAGELRLVRAGDAPASSAVTSRLAAGMRFTLLDQGGGTLDLLPRNRFRLIQRCGVTEGSWRHAPREVHGAHRFGPDRHPDACHAHPASRALGQAFLGNVDVAIGPNRDIALFAGRFGTVRARVEGAR